MSELVSLSRDGSIAVITVNNPPVNALSPGVPEGIADALEQAGGDPEVRAMVLIGAGQTFIAGADIKEFGKITSGQKPRDEGITRCSCIWRIRPSRWSPRSTVPLSAAASKWPWRATTAWRSLPRKSVSRR